MPLDPRTSGSPAPIVVTDAAVAIEGRPVLRNIALEVADGEFLALLGANGSGKSTLVRAMLGLRPLSQGRISLLGTDLKHFRDWHRIGFVPQRSGATSGVPASVREVVSAGRLPHRRLFRPLGARDRRAIDEAIDLVGLSERSKDGVGELSGGQQQRVLIARALAAEPELFFLDEPAAGVDLLNQQVLAQTLDTLKTRGVTIVLVAHELGPLEPLVDRAVVMRDGRIAYDGAPLADPTLHHPHLHSAGGHHHHERHRPERPAPLLGLDPGSQHSSAASRRDR